MRYLGVRLLAFFIIAFKMVVCTAQPIEVENYKKYSGACLSSSQFFNPGTYSFDVKASNTSGVIFCAFLTDFEVNRSEDYLKHIELGFELVGESTDTIKCVAVLYGRKYHIEDVPLGFNAAENFHNYKMVQEKDTIKWLVDDKLVWTLSADVAHQLLKPMRLFVNFRPAVSHCDIGYGWGCIRTATLPTFTYVKKFKYTRNTSLETNTNFKFNLFDKKCFADRFRRLNSDLWQISAIDLIKGNKPLYKTQNVIFGKPFLKMVVNRD